MKQIRGYCTEKYLSITTYTFLQLTKTNFDEFFDFIYFYDKENITENFKNRVKQEFINFEHVLLFRELGYCNEENDDWFCNAFEWWFNVGDYALSDNGDIIIVSKKEFKKEYVIL